MSIKKALIFLVFSGLLLTAGFANAASTDSRYFVKNTSGFWEKFFQARNVFSDGFSANLSDSQLKIARVFGISVEPVKKLNILATTTDTPTPVVTKKASVKTTPAPSPTPTPLAQTPTDNVDWGVRTVLGDSLNGIPSGGTGITVAVLDTGVDVSHPDLSDRIVGCEDFTGFGSLTDNTCTDNNGHGTHVAGIIAADGGTDGSGMYGIAPSANILAYKVCSDDGTCFADDVAAAIRYGVDNGAQVILVSAGSDSDSSLIDDAIAYAAAHDVMVVAAAGNDGPYSGSLDYPAADLNVISVGAIDQNGNVPDWSARGINSADKAYVRETGDLDFVAPGVDIQSTWNNGDYATLSGTSMAAAHIAGLAALEWQADATNPVEATIDILHKFSQDVSPTGDDNASGWGMPQL